MEDGSRASFYSSFYSLRETCVCIIYNHVHMSLSKLHQGWDRMRLERSGGPSFQSSHQLNARGGAGGPSGCRAEKRNRVVREVACRLSLSLEGEVAPVLGAGG